MAQAAPSASFGTHFGLTKLVASISAKSHLNKRFILVILVAVRVKTGSFCSPSRGLISKIRTLFWVTLIFHLAMACA